MIEDFDMAAVIKIIMDVKDQFVRLLCLHFYDSLIKVVLSIKFSFSFKSTKLMTGTPLNALQAIIDGFHSTLMD